MANLQSMPAEIIMEIWDQIERKESLLSFAQTCRRFHHMKYIQNRKPKHSECNKAVFKEFLKRDKFAKIAEAERQGFRDKKAACSGCLSRHDIGMFLPDQLLKVPPEKRLCLGRTGLMRLDYYDGLCKYLSFDEAQKKFQANIEWYGDANRKVHHLLTAEDVYKLSLRIPGANCDSTVQVNNAEFRYVAVSVILSRGQTRIWGNPQNYASQFRFHDFDPLDYAFDGPTVEEIYNKLVNSGIRICPHIHTNELRCTNLHVVRIRIIAPNEYLHHNWALLRPDGYDHNDIWYPPLFPYEQDRVRRRMWNAVSCKECDTVANICEHNRDDGLSDIYFRIIRAIGRRDNTCGDNVLFYPDGELRTDEYDSNDEDGEDDESSVEESFDGGSTMYPWKTEAHSNPCGARQISKIWKDDLEMPKTKMEILEATYAMFSPTACEARAYLQPGLNVSK
ncbi:hypothetical protein BDY21DRAFT_360549 [Lineolata rhizophorae]|uniref:F-box domain-containing protein n=1 Tax=Lineolata rhizophorae TaxID=578093 RepID=A0A6A6PC12_9PEZI|nr:hypothetical protein BDY21DRAFT_360549 [Lineolata rhizophorae]